MKSAVAMPHVQPPQPAEPAPAANAPMAQGEHHLLASRLAAIVQVQRLLASTGETPEELMDRIPEMALSVVDTWGAVFELLSGDHVVVRSGTTAVLSRDAIGVRIPLEGSLSGEAIRLDRTLRCDETEGDPRVAAAACRKYGLRSVLVTVVRDSAGPIGVLKLFDGKPARFGDAEADSLELLAEALGAAIQRKRAEAETKRMLLNQSGVIRLQQEIAASSAGLTAALDVIVARTQELTGCDGVALAIVDGDDMVYRAGSGVALPLVGRRFAPGSTLASHSLASRAILVCHDAEIDARVDRQACRDMGVRSVMSAPLGAGSSQLLGQAAPEGTLILHSAQPHVFTAMDLGTLQLIAEWLGVVLQRGAWADQLRRSEEQYRMLFAAHPLPMWVYDLETLHFLAVNDSAVAKYGYAREEFLAMTLRDIRTPAGVKLLETYLATRGDAPLATVSWQHRRKDGSLIDVESTDNDLRFEGRAARLVLFEDVTEKKRVEQQIQKSEALLSIAGTVARVGAWSHDMSDDSYSWTDELCAIYDLPAGTPSNVGRALGFYLPQSRKAYLAAATQLRVDGSPFDLELELVTARGRHLWVRSIAEPVRDGTGRVVGVRGAVQDISERREAEEKVRTLAGNLKRTLESITDAFYTLDREWRFTYVNVETERLMQRSRDDLMGRCMWDFFPQSEAGEFGNQMRAAAERNASAVFEVFYKPWAQWLEFHVYPSATGLTVYFRDVTERRQTQEQLLLLETCVAWMKDVVVISEVDGDSGSGTRIVFVNEAFVRDTGYSRAEAIGKTPHMLHGEKTPQGELDRIAAALVRREAVRAEVIYYTKAGAEYWADVEIVPVWSKAGEVTHFVSVMRDATGRRAAERTLQTQNETLEAAVAERTAELERSNDALTSKELEIRSVVEHMADGVITFDDHGIVRTANPKVEAIFGLAPPSLIGGPISLLLPALDGLVAGAGSASAVDAARAIATVGRETYGRHRSGEPIALDVAISDFQIGGRRLWTAIVRDIGERMTIMADLEKARQAAEEASSAKSAFVATMSHEIRTPMNGVIGMIDVLNQTTLAPDQSRMLGIARDSAHALLAIIEDILDFSKIEAGRLEIERLPISLGSVVEKAVALVHGMAVGRGVELAVVIDPQLPAAVWGDAGRLRQIVVNLVSNAIKFSAGRAGAEVSVRARLVTAADDRATLQLEVEDNGIGMDAATVDRLFLPFSQADASTTRRFGGTGLGLAISHHLVDLMGGYFDVRSTPGVGSVFSVRVPFFLAAASEIETGSPHGSTVPASTPAASTAKSAHAASRVLVAEDNDINQQVITEQLSRLGYRAVVVANGREALALWRDGAFDALLTDLQMPEMDGYELATTIRAEEAGRRRMPILALTANALKEEASRCKAAGMDDYLTKPVPMETLDAMLRRWLDLATAGAVPVDSQVLPALIGNDPALVAEFMLDFLDSATESTGEMATAVASADGERCRGIAHRLKSSARAIGAIHLGDLCDAVENAPLEEGDAGAVQAARLSALSLELDRVRRWIGAQGWSRSTTEALA